MNNSSSTIINLTSTFTSGQHLATPQDNLGVVLTNDFGTMWRGDKLFKTFALRADKDCLINISVVCENLPLLFTTTYAIQKVKAFVGNAGWYAQNRNGTLPTGERIEVCDILSPCNTLHLKAATTEHFALEINTDKFCNSGLNAIKINILCGDILQVLNLSIKVLALDFPAPCQYTFTTEYWHHPYNISDYYGVTPFGTEHLSILKDHMDFYKSIGGIGVAASIVEEAWGGQTYGKSKTKYPSMIKWIRTKSGNFKFDFTDFDKWLDLNTSCKTAEKIICYSMMPWGSAIGFFDEKSGQMMTKKYAPTFMFLYKRVWTMFLTAFIAHLDEKNIFDKIFIGFDERLYMSKVLKFLLSFKNKDGKSFKVSASSNNFANNESCFDLFDYVSVGLDEIRKDTAAFCKMTKRRTGLGLQTSLYTAVDHFPNSFSLSQPAEGYWSILYAYSLGTNGFLRWAFDAWVAQPLLDTTHCSFPAGDCFLVYPSERDALKRLPRWSYRLVKLDEGVRDANKLQILSGDPNIKIEIDALLQNIKPNYDYEIVRDNSWGVAIRDARWITQSAKAQLSADMCSLKSNINNLAAAFAEKLNK